MFEQATVLGHQAGAQNRVDPAVRIALTAKDLGPVRAQLERRLLETLPQVMAATGAGGAEPKSLELELAAHGDGAHFRRHVDLPLGRGRRPLGAKRGEDRVISAVLYFHKEPKRFSGGVLRLFRFGADHGDAAEDPANYVEVEPLQNSLVVFPSWVAHEVRTVRCPNNQFEHFRFALNCWYCRQL